MLQRNPFDLGRIPRTTCRLVECAEPDKIFMRSSFRLSLERSDRARPPNILGYRAVAALSQVKRSARGANRGKRGLGATGEEWWCLRCAESMLKAVRHYEFEVNPPTSEPPAHALMQWAQWIIPEERVIPAYPNTFHLEDPYKYALEKWKAVILYNSQQDGADFEPHLPPHSSRPDQLYTGTDDRSLYLTQETRDMRGLTDGGDEAEISAVDCQDVSLSEVFKRVGRIRDAIRRGKWELRLAKEREARAHAEQFAIEEESTVKEEFAVEEVSAVKGESAVKEESAIKEESGVKSTQFVLRHVSRRSSI